jgi:hypothetical protein
VSFDYEFPPSLWISYVISRFLESSIPFWVTKHVPHLLSVWL